MKKKFTCSTSFLCLCCFSLIIGESQAMRSFGPPIPPVPINAPSSLLNFGSPFSIPNSTMSPIIGNSQAMRSFGPPVPPVPVNAPSSLLNFGSPFSIPNSTISPTPVPLPVAPQPKHPTYISNFLNNDNPGLTAFVKSSLEPTFAKKTAFKPTFNAISGVAIALNAQKEHKDLKPDDIESPDNICNWYMTNWEELEPLFEKRDTQVSNLVEVLLFDTSKSEVKQELDRIFDRKVSMKQLLILANLCCITYKLKLTHEEKRSGKALVMWFERNWSKIRGYVQMISLINKEE